jgi:hypothetical protein
VEVSDTGVGIDRQRLDDPRADDAGIAGDGAGPTGHGRGLRLIRACADTVEIHPVHPRGLAIRVSKALTGNRDAPAGP